MVGVIGRAAVLWCVLIAVSCNVKGSTNIQDKALPMDEASPLQLSCAPDAANPLLLQCELVNTLDRTVHVFDSARMPYVLVEDHHTLVVLYGVHLPLTLTTYNIVEIPVTRPLEPGQRFGFSADLGARLFPNHYEEEPRPPDLSGTCRVVPRLGYLDAPVTPAEVSTLTIGELVERQHLIEAPALEVVFE